MRLPGHGDYRKGRRRHTFYDKNGLIVREFDRAPGAHGTVSGNGNSITFALTEVQVFTYPLGATIGAPASG